MARVTRPLETLRSAESAGCSISPEDASAQVARIAALRPHVVETGRRPGRLSLSFAAAADDAAIDRLIEVERGCCDFLRIEREHVGGTTRVVFATEDPAREPVLEAIAELFAP
jgi:hypothetical protein